MSNVLTDSTIRPRSYTIAMRTAAVRRVFRPVGSPLCVLALAAAYHNQAELVNFNGGQVQPQSLAPKHALTFRVEIGGHMVCTQTLPHAPNTPHPRNA